MGQSPFARKDLSQQAWLKRRRSTRIDYMTPVVLSGRDASGQPFREETTTLIVNLHGAKVRTGHKVLVGMLVTIESLKTGASGKAICVIAFEPEGAEPDHAIAVQLIQPGNIWGVEDPPPDWATVAAELGGQPLSPQRPGPTPAIPSPPAAPPSSAPSSVTAPAPVSRINVDSQLADFEQRAARVIESVLETLRVQSNVMVRESLANYEQRLSALFSEAQGRISQHIEQAAADLGTTVETIRTEAMGEMVQDTLQDFQRRLGQLSAQQEGALSQSAAQTRADFDKTVETARQRLADSAAKTLADLNAHNDKAFGELDTALTTFRSDLDDELAARREQAVQIADQALRSRVAAILSSILAPPAPPVNAPPAEAPTKK